MFLEVIKPKPAEDMIPAARVPHGNKYLKETRTFNRRFGRGKTGGGVVISTK